ncbi:hypothetical protein JTE90_001116 [Oedothorax gibbosus]|uniref:Uncharacterized protein n=1 Tax=Oedothorax gibbosus TaxID=931172 RepID=A0AAV6VIG4_9ARAC|nr:hypothetical protein JTE90_001116 [Oedothorax gibbosus]
MKVVLIFSLLAIVVFTEIFCDENFLCNPPCPPNQYCAGKYFQCRNYSGIGQLCYKEKFLCAPGLKCM